jgi:hypothetical protein
MEPEEKKAETPTVREIVDMILAESVSPTYTIHDELNPAQIEINWVIEEAECGHLISLSVFVPTSLVYRWIGTKVSGAGISLPDVNLNFFLAEACKKHSRDVLNVRVEIEDL